jgi:hypothetical protein
MKGEREREREREKEGEKERRKERKKERKKDLSLIAAIVRRKTSSPKSPVQRDSSIFVVLLFLSLPLGPEDKSSRVQWPVEAKPKRGG